MKKSVRLLLIEDCVDDADLLIRKLHRKGLAFHHKRVATRATLSSALKKESWDIVLSDFILPGFGALDALKKVRDCCPGLPFIVLSGAASEEDLVRAMKAGADDFILKTNTARLLPAIERELRAARIRRKTQTSLRLSENLLANILENSPAMISIKDCRSRYQMVNKRFEKIFGISSKEILGKTLRGVFPLKTVSKSDDFEQAVLSGGKPVEFEQNVKTKGGYRVLLSNKFLLHSEKWEERRICTISFDITKRKKQDQKIEAERAKVAKLESVGILAGGIAHDFNNLLTTILGSTSLIRSSMTINDPYCSEIRLIESATLNARKLTQQLMTFAKGGSPVKETASIPDVVREAADFALRGSNVRVRFSIPSSAWAAEIDRGQIAEVIQNLILNGDQAMPDGGTIHISVENVVLPNGTPSHLPPGKYSAISVKDQGIGIPEKFLEKIFDPYFTSKEKGHGLGLAVCHSIIRDHGGTITVDSRIGKGAQFRILLPASDSVAAAAAPAPKTLFLGKGTVLLMDDEQAIGYIASRMLNRLGFQVEHAKHGAEALASYKSAKDAGRPFTTVIMDLTVPGEMGGKQLMEQLLAYDSKTRGIASSGYSSDPVMSDPQRFGFSGILTKPYTIEDMAETLERVLQ